MFRKILVSLDGSENAERVLPWLKRYAGPDRAMALLVRVIPPDVIADQLPSGAAVGEAREYLQSIERELNYAGIPTKLIVVRGEVASAIVRIAKKEKCDLIAMTTRGGSPVTRWLIGGATDQVLRMSAVPVLAVRSQTRMANQGRVRRIIVPLDASGKAASALPYAEKLAAFHKARIVLLHVRTPGTEPGLSTANDSAARAFKRWSESVVKRLGRKRIQAKVKVDIGDPAETIIGSAERGDLIVMTTHGRGGFKRWVFGSVAEKVIREAVAPVLVYKAAGKSLPKPMRHELVPTSF